MMNKYLSKTLLALSFAGLTQAAVAKDIVHDS